MKVLHIVRQFGPVGGMERYAWEVARAQAEMGMNVSILCEVCHDQDAANIQVHVIGQGLRRPRWLSALLFSRCVTRWIKEHPQTDTVIHSHETTGVHHITTLHGPPFARIKARGWWKMISLRVLANLWLEQREVCGPQVQKVIPNSTLISQALSKAYPCIGSRMASAIVPGVEPGPTRPARAIPADGGVIGFIGKEWRRKGLDIAVGIVQELRRHRPKLEFQVLGPDPEDVRHLFHDWQGGFQLLGKTDAQPHLPNMDLLLHPARYEPFGMVITEALAAHVPVVISDMCGASDELQPGLGKLLKDGSPVSDWAAACEDILNRQSSIPDYQRSWQQVAKEYMEIYRTLDLRGQ